MFGKPSTNLEDYIRKIPAKYFWIVSGVFTAVVYIFIFSVCGMLSNGNYTILRLDMIHQYVPFAEYLMDVIKGKHGYWFSWGNFMGFGNAGMYAHCAMSPFNLIYLFFPKKFVLTATVIIVIGKAVTSAMFMQLFLSYFLKRKEFFTVIFSVLYSLCGYQITYYCGMNFTDSVYLLPLIMYAIIKLIRGKRIILLYIAYTILFISCFYMGYMIGICSFILGFMYFLYSIDKREKNANFKIAFNYIICSVSAVATAAIVWLPAIIQHFKYGEKDYYDPFLKQTNPLIAANNLLIGEYQSMEGYTPYIYCGLLTVFCVIAYFFNRKVKMKEKIMASVSIAVFFVFFSVKPLDRFMHGFDTPQMLAYRYSFVLSFILCVIACRESLFIKGINVIKTGLVLIIGAGAIFTYSFMWYGKNYKDADPNRVDVIIVNILVVILISTVIYLFQKKKMDLFTFRSVLVSIACFELVMNGVMVLGYSKEINLKRDAYNAYVQLDENTISSIDDDNEKEFFRMQMTSDVQSNKGLVEGLYTIGSYNSYCQADVLEFMHSMGSSSQFHLIGGRGLTPVLRSLLGVKYYSNCDVEQNDKLFWFVGDTDNLVAQYLHENNGIGTSIVKKNDKYLSLGYMVSDEIKNFSYFKSPFEGQNELLSKMCGESIECFSSADFSVNTNDGILLQYDKGIVPAFDEKLDGTDMSDGWIFISKDYSDKTDEAMNSGSVSDLVRKSEEDGSEESKDTRFDFVISDEGKQVYSFFDRTVDFLSSSYITSVDETDIKENYAPVHLLAISSITQLGHNEDKDYEVSVVIPEGTSADYCEGIYFASFDEGEYERAYDKLKQNQLNIDEFGDGFVNGTIDAGEGGVMFTSIPYDEGWECYVDGQKTSLVPLLDRAFIGIDLSEGQHRVEMKYSAEGMKLGWLITIAGILSFGVLLFTQCERKKKVA